MRLIIIVLTVLRFTMSTVEAGIISGLYYSGTDGQNKSYVSQGRTEVIQPGVDGFLISTQSVGSRVNISMTNFTMVPAEDYRWVYLDFSSGNDQPLSTGKYSKATRHPFNEVETPGLSFVMDGRGNNTLTGEFEILEITRSPFDGSLQKFAADFVQRGDNKVPEFGSVRFNSEIPFTTVPEPSTASLLVLSLLVRMLCKRVV